MTKVFSKQRGFVGMMGASASVGCADVREDSRGKRTLPTRTADFDRRPITFTQSNPHRGHPARKN